MEIFAAILGSLVAVFIGAWINNIFIWKIKGKIKALDNLYMDINLYNDAFLRFGVDSQNSSDDPKLFLENMRHITRPIINKVYLSSFIIDDKKCGPVYKKILSWSKSIESNIPRHHTYFKSETEQKEYQKLFHDVINTIYLLRKKITSFKYMLKICLLNWQTLVFVLIVTILSLVYYVVSHAQCSYQIIQLF